MAGKDVPIKCKDGEFTGYLAMPPSGKGPGLVVIQEVFGVNQVMREITDNFAKQGFVALCPDLFWRQEPGVQITDKTDAEWKKAFELYNGFNVDKGVEDIQATIDVLAKTPGCTGKTGATGFCLGGLLAYLAACRTSAAAGVGYYGVGIENYMGEAGKIKGGVMLHIAEEDKFVPKDVQAKVKQGLAGNPKVTIHSYPGQDHAFCRVGGQHYSKDACETATKRTLEFFKAHLG
jgi:carboxymethylenebutenolidase